MEEDGKNKGDSASDISSSGGATRRRISDGIQTLMTRLSLGSSSSRQDSSERWISPWHLDLLCNTELETALHAAVRQGYSDIASLLLAAGANPNIPSQNVIELFT